MDLFCVPNRLKAKKTSSGLKGKLTIKKNRMLFEIFLNKTSLFFAFLTHLETSHFLH